MRCLLQEEQVQELQSQLRGVEKEREELRERLADSETMVDMTKTSCVFSNSVMCVPANGVVCSASCHTATRPQHFLGVRPAPLPGKSVSSKSCDCHMIVV